MLRLIFSVSLMLFDVWRRRRRYRYDWGVIITPSAAAAITSGFTSFHDITPSDDRQTCRHEGVGKCAEAQSAQTAPPAPATVTGWTSATASLAQITATSPNNSGHISISRIDLRQDVLKKKKERL